MSDFKVVLELKDLETHLIISTNGKFFVVDEIGKDLRVKFNDEIAAIKSCLRKLGKHV